MTENTNNFNSKPQVFNKAEYNSEFLTKRGGFVVHLRIYKL